VVSWKFWNSLGFSGHGRQRGSVAERQILFDPINVGCSEDPGLSQRPAAFRTFALKQMASAGAPEKYFAGAGYLETFDH